MNPNFPKTALLGLFLAAPLHAEDVVMNVKTTLPVPAPADATLQATGRTAPAEPARSRNAASTSVTG
jgi:hypothetical protein